MGPTEGLRRGLLARDTGAPISVPVGEAVLGRMLNVLGEPLDGFGAGEPWQDGEGQEMGGKGLFLWPH